MVLRHLRDFGSITSWEAIQQYGNTRLSATIYTLRHRYGYLIEGEMETFVNRYGYTSQFARYTLGPQAKRETAQTVMEEWAKTEPAEEPKPECRFPVPPLFQQITA